MFRCNDFGLPSEITLQIFLSLDLKSILSISSVNQCFNNLAQDNHLWKMKFKTYFPFRYKKIVNQLDISWRDEFRKAFDISYSNVTYDIKKLFIAIKERDINVIKRVPLPMEYLDKEDNNGMPLLDCAQLYGGQAILDYIYEIATIYYTDKSGLTVDIARKDKHNRTILYWALSCHQPHEQIKLLMLQGSNVKERYLTGEHPIHIAVERDMLTTVMHFIDHNPDLLEQTAWLSRTPLIWSAMDGLTSIARYLVNKGANVNAAAFSPQDDANGKTSLYYAVENGFDEIVTILVNAGAILTTNHTKSQPVHVAALDGKLNIFKTLVDKKPDLLEQVDECKQTPLLLAAARGHDAIVKYCLAKGANLNVKTQGADKENYGKTSLHWVAERGHVTCAALLITAGADVNITFGDMQYQAIHCAAINGQTEIVALLIQKDRKQLEQQAAAGQTPLFLAASHGQRETVSYLVGQKANVDAITNWRPGYEDYDKSPLYIAAERGYDLIVDILLKAGASYETATGKLKRKPIHIAAQKGFLHVVKILIENRQACMEQTDAGGDNALFSAAQYGHADIVQYLIEKGANVNATICQSGKSEDSMTPLQYAVRNGCSDVVVVLLKAGATLAPGTKICRGEKLNEEAENLFRIEEYHVERIKKDDYVRSITLFGITRNFGAAKERKLAAVQALKDVYFFGKDNSVLNEYEYELNNGELGRIYQGLKHDSLFEGALTYARSFFER